MGKTTLAQLVYNDARVTQEFDMKAWACVSDPFDIKTITKKILDGVTRSNNDIESLDELQIKLKETLKEKKFLVVLDDVWKHAYDDWNRLRIPFSDGAHGSRIIVTTRIDDVASAMGTIPSHCLEELSFKDCWSLFEKHAFQSGDCMAHSERKIKIGEQIVQKCKGLPLAVISLGGLLRSKQDMEGWKEILESQVWHLESNVSPALQLSYNDLASHLKRCFVHCSKFPKDYNFEKEKLVRLWIAEDLVQQPKSKKSVEDEGHSYFLQLLSRSFFQVIFVCHFAILIIFVGFLLDLFVGF
ncbi:putative disease resistance RPP13-like protein 1 isoform X1 [Cornus florida]|uniref:putative disease resistance RPP13-like protein 1 isoform X1 n=1 Tax=Cornus florida TaxID=4283 RepID=UPI00289C9284|nr:putative disease resistance RPP13-like protein 1 isoform X1 [Cornus florida]XP_059646356.1 putative disease resistance RPP13-like protein 1 isoform X1 [Cornus florida]